MIEARTGAAATWITDGQPCPACGRHLDRASHLSDKGHPSKGDLTVCFGCVSVLRFDQELRLRAVTDTELRRLKVQQPETAAEVRSLQKGLLQFHAQADRAGFKGEA